MTIEAELDDGTIYEFPDGTHDDVINRTVKREMGLVGPGPAPSWLDRGKKVVSDVIQGAMMREPDSRVSIFDKPLGEFEGALEAATKIPGNIVAGAQQSFGQLQEQAGLEARRQLRTRPLGPGTVEQPARMTLTPGGQPVLGEPSRLPRLAEARETERAGLERQAQAARDLQAMRPPRVGDVGEAIISGAQSGASTALGIGGSLMTGSPVPMIAGAVAGGLQQGAATTKEAMEKGLPYEKAALHGTVGLLSEMGGELLPIGVVLKPGSSLAGKLFQTAVVEGGQEYATELFQSLYAMAQYDPEMTMSEALRRAKIAGYAGSMMGIAGSGPVIAAQAMAQTTSPAARVGREIERGVAETTLPDAEAAAIRALAPGRAAPPATAVTPQAAVSAPQIPPIQPPPAPPAMPVQPQGEPYAIREPGPAPMDVREQAGYGAPVGEAHPVEELARAQAPEVVPYRGGAPQVAAPEVTLAQDVGAMGLDEAGRRSAIQRMTGLARQGLSARDWYKESARAVLDAFNGNVTSADRLLQLLSITSAGAEVKANFTMATKALEQYARGQPIHVGTGQVDKSISDLLYHGIPWSARKTSDFYQNLAQYLPGYDPAERAVTDRHQFRIASGEHARTSGTKRQYEFASDLTGKVAQKLGISPDQAQAAMWVAFKGHQLFTRMKASRDTAKGSKFAGMSDKQLRDIARTEAMTSFASEIERRQWAPPPGITFPGLAEVRAAHQTLAAEVRPSTKTEIGQRISKLMLTHQTQFQRDVFKQVVSPADFFRAFGLENNKVTYIQSTGGYEGQRAPNLVAELAVSHDEAANIAAAWAYVFQQDSVSMSHPNPQGPVAGVMLTFNPGNAEGVLTNAQEARAYEWLRSVHPDLGYTRVSDTEFAVLNFTDLADADFRVRMTNATANTPIAIEEVKHYAAEAELVPAAEDSGRWAGRPDLQARLDDWRSRFQSFAEGWSPEARDVTLQQGEGERPWYYSELRRQVEKGPARASAEQWLGYLKGLQSKGVKAEEIEFSGIRDIIEMTADGGPITREVLTSWLDDQGVKISEEMLGGAKLPEGFSMIRSPEGVRITWDSIKEFTARKPDVHSAAISLMHLLEYGARQQQRLNAAKADRLFVAAERMNEYVEALEGMGPAGTTRYETYVLPGGENYRELLITLPLKMDSLDTVARRLYGKTYDELDSGAKSFVQRNLFQTEDQPRYQAPHFGGAENILAHVRFNERTDANGKRVLFIEEIQSDWAQQGKREGFRQKSDQVPPEYALIDENEEARREGFNVPADAPQRWRFTGPTVSSRVYSSRSEALAAAIRDANLGKAQVPRAPFVGKTESWTALALKRMIRYAAENGFDRIAWTTGEQQAQRYDLSKQIGSVEVTKQVDGGYHVEAKTKDRNRTITSRRYEAKELPEVIGKELADRALKDLEIRPFVLYEGLDLKVGGEGMQAFYDRIVPNVANDVLKKLGGPRVDAGATIGVGLPIANKEMAALRDQTKERSTNQGFDITPALKARVMGEGIALFQKLKPQRQAMYKALHDETMLQGAAPVRVNLGDASNRADKLTAGQARFVDLAAGRLAKAGIAQDILTTVPMVVHQSPEAATYNVTRHRISFREDMLNAGMAGEPGIDQWLPNAMAHEISHALDRGTSLSFNAMVTPDVIRSFASARSPRFDFVSNAATTYNGEIWAFSEDSMRPEGDIMGEVWHAFWNGPQAVRMFFQYPFMSFPLDQDATIKTEVFAQLGALYATSKAVMREHLPVSFKALEEIYGKTTFNQAAQAVQTTLQSRPTASDRPSVELRPSRAGGTGEVNVGGPPVGRPGRGVGPPGGQGGRSPVLTPEQQAVARTFLAQPTTPLPQGPGEKALPTHHNYEILKGANTRAEVLEVLRRLSEQNEREINKQRRGTVSWQKTYDEAQQKLVDLLGNGARKALVRRPGTPAGAAEIHARQTIAVTAADYVAKVRDEIAAGQNTPEKMLELLGAIERAGMVSATFLGARAEAGRALNILKSTRSAAERVKAMQQVIDEWKSKGGTPAELVEKLKLLTHPAQILAFSRAARQSTLWDKLMFAWKAGLISGMTTTQVNLLSNMAFMGLRIPSALVSGLIGKLHGGNKAYMSESIAMAVGMTRGMWDAIKVGAGVLATGKEGIQKSEVRVSPFESSESRLVRGVGQVVGFPYRFLGFGDAIFRTLNERGEAYALATRQALKEGKRHWQGTFWDRVQDLVDNPSQIDGMEEQIEAAGRRFTFNEELGKKGQAFQRLLRVIPAAQPIFPFVRTPGNIFKETARLGPMAPMIQEWRADIRKGGAARDRALGELVTGSAMLALVSAIVNMGLMSGGGDPDTEKRRVQREAGWKPYAINKSAVERLASGDDPTPKPGDEWVDGYLRMAPIGTLMGLAADATEFRNYMSEEEHEKWVRMLGYAFAQNVTNQTFMRGFTEVVNVMQDPGRYGENYLESLAGSVVPGAVGQFTTQGDPFIREVQGMREAVMSRLPKTAVTPEFNREALPLRRDLWGAPLETKPRAWPGAPFTLGGTPPDEVRKEAARLRIDIGLPGKSVSGVKLSQEQYSQHSQRAGELAHSIMADLIETPGYQRAPDWAKRELFKRVLTRARDAAAKEMKLELGPEKILEQKTKGMSDATTP